MLSKLAAFSGTCKNFGLKCSKSREGVSWFRRGEGVRSNFSDFSQEEIVDSGELLERSRTGWVLFTDKEGVESW